MTAAALTVDKDRVVTMHYTLRDVGKEIIDSSDGSAPLLYLHGHGQIVAGLEKALGGKKAGDKLAVEVSAAEGYGEYQAVLKIEVNRSQFPKDAPIEAGSMFELAGEDNHSLLARIVEVNGDKVTLDANHPLAGKTLYFEVEVVAVRAATQEELAHGHAHGAGGHHHH